MQEQPNQLEHPDVQVMSDARVIRSIAWKRMSVETRARPDERMIIELINEHSGMKARIELRDDVVRTRIARVDFIHERELIAQASVMYALGDMYMIRGMLGAMRDVTSTGDGWRQMNLEISEPGAHVGATWFQIDGYSTMHVLRDLFGDVLGEAL